MPRMRDEGSSSITNCVRRAARGRAGASPPVSSSFAHPLAEAVAPRCAILNEYHPMLRVPLFAGHRARGIEVCSNERLPRRGRGLGWGGGSLYASRLHTIPADDARPTVSRDGTSGAAETALLESCAPHARLCVSRSGLAAVAPRGRVPLEYSAP